MLNIARSRQEHLRTVIEFNGVEVTCRNGKYSSYVLLYALEEVNLSKEIYSPGLCYFKTGPQMRVVCLFSQEALSREWPQTKVKQCLTCRTAELHGVQHVKLFVFVYLHVCVSFPL